MINRKVMIGILMAVALAFSGCSTGIGSKTPGNNSPTDQGQQNTQKPPKMDTSKPEQIDPVKVKMDKMTLNEKIGQMVIVGLDGYEVDDNTRTIIEKYQVGGFILFGKNISDSNQLRALNNSLKSTNTKNEIPLFISVDEEGGSVSRMPAEFQNLPNNKEIGKVNNGDFSYKIGGILAEEIKSFGFNMDFAPVLDINSNPKNPVIGDRSFGSNANIVSKLGIKTMKGIQMGGVIPVVKHFPGHGDTAIDSHVGLPSVNNDLGRLKSFELIPFDEAIKNNAEAVMIAHILMKKIDAENPASLSPTIITDILRKQLNFNGVVITDDMTMGAIIENYKIEEAAVKSVNAGCDIVLVCHGYDNEVVVIETLKKAVEAGTISRERVDESVYRILKLKHKYNITDKTIELVDVEKINSKIQEILDEFQKLR